MTIFQKADVNHIYFFIRVSTQISSTFLLQGKNSHLEIKNEPWQKNRLNRQNQSCNFPLSYKSEVTMNRRMEGLWLLTTNYRTGIIASSFSPQVCLYDRSYWSFTSSPPQSFFSSPRRKIFHIHLCRCYRQNKLPHPSVSLAVPYFFQHPSP